MASQRKDVLWRRLPLNKNIGSWREKERGEAFLIQTKSNKQMNTLLWTQHSFCGSIPSPRHNHIFHTVDENQLILFGGWSRGTIIKKTFHKNINELSFYLLVLNFKLIELFRGWWNGELFDTYFNDVYLLDMGNI